MIGETEWWWRQSEISKVDWSKYEKCGRCGEPGSHPNHDNDMSANPPVLRTRLYHPFEQTESED